MRKQQLEEFIRPDDSLLSHQQFSVHISRYEFASDYVVDKVVLDIACGSGYGTAYLHHRGAAYSIGGDVSLQALNYAANYYRRDGVEFAAMEATRLPFSDHIFDVVVTLETLEHLFQPEDFIAEVARVLKDNGIMILSTPNKTVYSPGSEEPVWPFHVHEYRVDELRQLLCGSFGDVELYGQCAVTHRTSRRREYLNGLATVVKPIVRKLPFGVNLARGVTAILLRDYRLVDISRVQNLQVLAKADDVVYRLADSALSNAVPTTLVAVARKPCPKT